jgi:hypothetical protein
MLGMPLNRSTGHTMRTLSETEIGETVAYQGETLAHYRPRGVLTESQAIPYSVIAQDQALHPRNRHKRNLHPRRFRTGFGMCMR